MWNLAISGNELKELEAIKRTQAVQQRPRLQDPPFRVPCQAQHGPPLGRAQRLQQLLLILDLGNLLWLKVHPLHLTLLSGRGPSLQPSEIEGLDLSPVPRIRSSSNGWSPLGLWVEH